MLVRNFARCRIFSRLFSSETSNETTDKMPKSQPGYFVVTHGYTPGIYRDYNRVLEQVTGYQCGRYKKFPTYDDAYFYYFHARHTEVAEQERQTERFEKVFKQAVVREKREKELAATGVEPENNSDASLLASELDIVNTFCNVSQDSSYKRRAQKDTVPQDEAPRKSARIKTQKQYADLVNLDEDEGEFSLEQFENDIIKSIQLESDKLTKRKRKTPATRNPRGRPKKELKNKETGETFTAAGVPIVYTDGCCLNSQKLDESMRRAGCGVYWGRDDPRNVVERLWGTQTNQRAELWAAIRGVQSAMLSDYEAVEIRTDSQYVISGMTEWILNWRKNNWVTRGKHPVKNRDLFVLLDGLSCYIDVRWVKVKGHSSIGGNDMADALARCGASLSERKIPVLNPPSKQTEFDETTGNV